MNYKGLRTFSAWKENGKPLSSAMSIFLTSPTFQISYLVIRSYILIIGLGNTVIRSTELK